MKNSFIPFRIQLRRGEGWVVKPEAEQLDGKVHPFRFGWIISSDESSIYAGEGAWIAHPDDWPEDAPAWIASGDLVKLVEPFWF